MSDDRVRKLQDTLTDVAKSNPKRKFYSLRDKLYRTDVLERAWDAVLSNRGAPGPEGVTTAHIKEQGIEAFLLELQEGLRTGTYRPGPVLRVYIPPEEVAEDLNLAVTGWCEYFKWSWHGKAFSKVHEYLRCRFKRFLRRRQNKPGLGRYRDLPERAVQNMHGLRTRWGSMVFRDQPRRECGGRAV